ncbi:hypothetical protein [Streptomyces sp. AP-93]|uniref:hypothetical protein n=1 Tax=Streptomyces sp. AP-93 TaxID=2929048 RepID=UPI001FAEBDA5|nr:hypothetical protein [Streptomyces sp. AP-93]MCJ0868684.1 hypothetical protein [Streptomyces sp. AP-93]
MRWVDEGGRHEGHLAAVLADGSEPGPAADGNTLWWVYNGADAPRAIGVRGACSCGWRGGPVHPIDFGDDMATEGYEERTGPYADWDFHVTQVEGVVPPDVDELLASLRQRIGELSASGQALTALRVAARVERTGRETGVEAVRSGRRQLVRWEAIGKAYGISRQAAQQRFARHVQD